MCFTERFSAHENSAHCFSENPSAEFLYISARIRHELRETVLDQCNMITRDAQLAFEQLDLLSSSSSSDEKELFLKENPRKVLKIKNYNE